MTNDLTTRLNDFFAFRTQAWSDGQLTAAEKKGLEERLDQIKQAGGDDTLIKNFGLDNYTKPGTSTLPNGVKNFVASNTYKPEPSKADIDAGKASLQRGLKGPQVRELQNKLNDAGAKPPLKLDGLFGPKTEAELKAFQGRQGITASGVADKATFARLAAPSTPTTDNNPKNVTNAALTPDANKVLTDLSSESAPLATQQQMLEQPDGRIDSLSAPHDAITTALHFNPKTFMENRQSLPIFRIEE